MTCRSQRLRSILVLGALGALATTAHANAVRTMTHTGSVRAVAYAPNGAAIAAGGADKTVTVWNANTGKRVRSLTGHTGRINTIVFSPDGKLIASGSSDRTVRIWNAKTGKALRTLTGHRGSVTSVAFAPNSKIVASAGQRRGLRVWNATTGALVKELTGHRSAVLAVAFHPKKKKLASGGFFVAKLWHPVSGATFKSRKVPVEDTSSDRGIVRQLAWTADGSKFVMASNQGIHIWDTTSEDADAEQLAKRESYGLALQPTGNLVAGTKRNKVVLWDASTKKKTATLTGHRRTVNAVAFHPKGTHVASASSDGTVKIWKAAAPAKAKDEGW